MQAQGACTICGRAVAGENPLWHCDMNGGTLRVLGPVHDECAPEHDLITVPAQGPRLSSPALIREAAERILPGEAVMIGADGRAYLADRELARRRDAEDYRRQWVTPGEPPRGLYTVPIPVPDGGVVSMPVASKRAVAEAFGLSPSGDPEDELGAPPAPLTARRLD
jgi:hypothetical protein